MDPPNFCLPQLLKPNAKFKNPTITPSERKVTGAERRRRKPAINSGHLVSWQCTQAARANVYDWIVLVVVDINMQLYSFTVWMNQQHRIVLYSCWILGDI
jgi:hypothetical protein